MVGWKGDLQYMALPVLFLWGSRSLLPKGPNQTRLQENGAPGTGHCEGTLRSLRPPFPTHLGPRRDQLWSASIKSGAGRHNLVHLS